MANYLMKKFPFFPAQLPFFEEDEFSNLMHWPDSNNNISIYEEEENITVEAALPGLSPEDINLIFEKGVLHISGNKKEVEGDKEKKFYRKATRSFSYRITVPGAIDDTTEPHAEYKDGVMTIRFTKHKKSQPKRITIRKV